MRPDDGTHREPLDQLRHEHSFVTPAASRGERRTRWVIALTVTMMIVEIAAGLVFGSMALLADGWHMATHAAALGITVFAYAYARRHAGDPRFSFGTGKVGVLGGFGSGVALGVVALLVFAESAWRLTAPVRIRFDEAIAVACIGLAVNVASALLLRDPESDDHRHRDHNLRAAYMHVLADALTSILAIAALVTGRFLGWHWMDPIMGLVGSCVIARWSWGLLRDTGRVLLDAEVDAAERDAIRAVLEADADNRVADLHVWRVGPRHFAVILSIVTGMPRPAAHYKGLLAGRPDLVHITVEVVGAAVDH